MQLTRSSLAWVPVLLLASACDTKTEPPSPVENAQARVEALEVEIRSLKMTVVSMQKEIDELKNAQPGVAAPADGKPAAGPAVEGGKRP